MENALIFAFVMLFFVWTACFTYVFFVRKAPIYHPSVIFLFYFLAGYVYRCLALAIEGGSDMWTFTGIPIQPSDIIYATFVAILGLLSFVFAPILLVRDSLTAERLPPISLISGRPHVFIIVLAALGYLGVKALGTAFNLGLTDLEQLSAVETYIDAAGGRQLVDVSGYETAASGFLPAILVLFLYSRRSIIALTAGFAAYVVFCLWAGTPRIGFVSATLAFLIAIMVRMRIGTPSAKHMIVIVVCLALFDLIGANRASIKEWAAGQIELSTVFERYALDRGSRLPLSDMHEFDSTVMVIHLVPDSTGFNFGTPYLRIFTWPIPRQWWPDKPISTDRITWLNYGNFINQTKSLIGMAYADLGLPSVIFTLGLIGVALNLLFRSARRAGSAYAFVAFALTTMFAPIIFRDGGIVFVYFIGVPFLGASIAMALGRVRLIGRDDAAGGSSRPYRLKFLR